MPEGGTLNNHHHHHHHQDNVKPYILYCTSNFGYGYKTVALIFEGR
jgi:hypothetical protein